MTRIKDGEEVVGCIGKSGTGAHGHQVAERDGAATVLIGLQTPAFQGACYSRHTGDSRLFSAIWFRNLRLRKIIVGQPEPELLSRADLSRQINSTLARVW